MRERLFQFLQLRRRAVDFDAGEIGNFHRLRQKRADIVEMREQSLSIFIRFAAEKLVAVHGKFVEKISFFSRSFLDEPRQHRLDAVDLTRMNPKIGVETNEIGESAHGFTPFPQSPSTPPL